MDNDKFWSASVKTDTSVIVSVSPVMTLTTFSRVPCHGLHCCLLYHVLSLCQLYNMMCIFYILDLIKSSSWCEDVSCILCDYKDPVPSLDLTSDAAHSSTG